VHWVKSSTFSVGMSTWWTPNPTAPAKAKAIFNGFARHVSTSEKSASLEQTVMTSPVALNCKIVESSDGLLVDSFHTGIETDYGEPLMLFRWDAFNRMFDSMAELFGTGGEVMLLYEGMAIGEMNAHEIIRRMGKDTITRNMPSVIRMLSTSGWGNTSLEFSEDGSPVVRIDHCFESATRKKVRHGCYFMKGMLTGVAKVILGPEVKCEETKCTLRGDDYCEFTLSIDSLA
jgi:predicted hydrocarbon binding protein